MGQFDEVCKAPVFYDWPTLLQGLNMKNPEYFRLFKDGSFVGFKRVVTEYLPAGHSTWQLAEESHDETQKLSKPGVGIENLKRESLSIRNINKLSVSNDANENRNN